jgi:hypothetical protein
MEAGRRDGRCPWRSRGVRSMQTGFQRVIMGFCTLDYRALCDQYLVYLRTPLLFKTDNPQIAPHVTVVRYSWLPTGAVTTPICGIKKGPNKTY